MVGYKVVDANELEGAFKRVRQALGVQAFGLNQHELPPNREAKEHDHGAEGQEEVYVVLAGSGVLRVEGDEVELRPGRYVFVPPQMRRQLVAGPDGLSCLAIGAAPDSPPRI